MASNSKANASVFPQQEEFLESLTAAVDHASEAKLSRVAELAVQHKQKNYKLVHHHLEKSWSTCKQPRTRRNLLYCISHVAVSARAELGSASKYGTRMKPLIEQVLKSMRDSEFKDHAYRTVALWRKRKVFSQTDIEHFNSCLGVVGHKRADTARKPDMGNASATQPAQIQQPSHAHHEDDEYDIDMDGDASEEAMIKEESSAIAAALLSSQQPSTVSNAAQLPNNFSQLDGHVNGSLSGPPQVAGDVVQTAFISNAADMLSTLASKLAEATAEHHNHAATTPPPPPPWQAKDSAQILGSSPPLQNHEQQQTPSYERGLTGMSPTISDARDSEHKPQRLSLPESYVLSPDKPQQATLLPPPPPPPPPPLPTTNDVPQPPQQTPAPPQPPQIYQAQQTTSYPPAIPGLSGPQHSPYVQPPFYSQHLPPGLGLPASYPPLIPGIHSSQPPLPSPPMQAGNFPQTQPPPLPPPSVPSYKHPMPAQRPVPSSPEPVPPPPPPPLPEDTAPTVQTGAVAGGPPVPNLPSALAGTSILPTTMTGNPLSQPAIPGISPVPAPNSMNPWAQSQPHQFKGNEQPSQPQMGAPDDVHRQTRPPLPPATSQLQAPSSSSHNAVNETRSTTNSKRKSRWEQAVDIASDAYDPFGE